MRSHQCFSPHAAPPGSESKKLEWDTPRMDERVRVLKWTCDCRTPVYEFCAAGGQYFIRRIEAHRVDESTRLRCRDAEELWTALLTGRSY